MSDSSTATSELTSDHLGWLVGQRPSLNEPLPRLRLLYHADLARLGAVSLPGTVPLTGEWITVGRNQPGFLGIGATATAAPIGDPYVSREQLRLRWRPEARAYEVAPIENARRPLFLISLSAAPGGGALPEPTPILGPTLLEPGSCLALGDRVLLGLDVGDFRQPDADRMGMVGESAAAWSLRDQIRALAQFNRPVLVNGPTGSGKELVAQSLHRQSPRAGGPFVAVNCAALPESLVESTLFGYRKGAFTGAASDDPGMFRAADGGTLFLDEVGELPLSVQPKILRVLQEGVVLPVGTHQERRVDVRVVTATHRDLLAQQRAGTLREDLYHRISAHILRVPSLNERRFDIPQLFLHLLEGHRQQHPELEWLWSSGANGHPGVPIGFIADLMRADWTGNIRELQNVVERTALLNLQPGVFRDPGTSRSRPSPSAPEPVVDTPPRGRASVPASPAREKPSDDALLSEAIRAAAEALGLASKTAAKLLSRQTLLAIQAELESTGGRTSVEQLRAQAAEALLSLLESNEFNQSAVAEALNVSRTTLIKLMDDLGLPRAAELSEDVIAQARAQAGGDLATTARLLRVSPVALQKRLASLGRGAKG